MLQKLRTIAKWSRIIRTPLSLWRAIQLYRAGRGGADVANPAVVSLRVRGNPLSLHCRPATSDFTTFLEIFVEGEYAAARQWKDDPPRHIIDLGTNVGFSVAFFESLFPEAQFIAVEPDVGNATMARRTLAPLIAAGRVHLHEAFAGASARMAAFAPTDRGSNEYRLGHGAGSIPVETVRSLLAAHKFPRIDLLKCDIEGSERELFESCADWIGSARRLVVELHDGLDEQWLITTLASQGANFRPVEVERRRGDVCLAWVERN